MFTRTAICKCPNGHQFFARVLAEEADTNATVVEDCECPECGEQEFEIVDVEYDHDDD